jgi:hypothetical protein
MAAQPAKRTAASAARNRLVVIKNLLSEQHPNAGAAPEDQLYLLLD